MAVAQSPRHRLPQPRLRVVRETLDMNIPYASRSKFIAPCHTGITAQQEALDAGHVIRIALEVEKEGYPGKIQVSIAARNVTKFETNWSASDPTRFPARLKAAVTALRDCGCWGDFDISHADGVLSIGKTGL